MIGTLTALTPASCAFAHRGVSGIPIRSTATIAAGTIPAASIQRHAESSGWTIRMRIPIAAPDIIPRAWKLNIAMMGRSRMRLGMNSATVAAAIG